MAMAFDPSSPASDKRSKKDGRGKVGPIIALVILVAFAAWHVRHAMPASLFAVLTDSWMMDHGDHHHRHDRNFTMDLTKMIKIVDEKEEKESHDQQEEKNDKTSINIISARRKSFEETCINNDTSMLDDKALSRKIDDYLAAIFRPPMDVPKLGDDNNNKDPVKPCMYTFIDLGANIGDSLGKFIDAGFLTTNCSGLMERIKSRPRYDIERGHMKLGDLAANDLTSFANQCLRELSHKMPEDYCYVGVEGNPVFTKRLQELEGRVMGTTPRPVRAAHFYTDSVAAGVDGPTVLYLDTVTTQHNFWGSSIYTTPMDVQKSAKINNGTTVKAHVMGLALSTLVKRSVQQVDGAHLLIKVDIEGGEYPVMNEVIETLCSYTSAGVRVDVILELHDYLFVANKEDKEFKLFHHQTLAKLDECKVHRAGLNAWQGQL